MLATERTAALDPTTNFKQTAAQIIRLTILKQSITCGRRDGREVHGATICRRQMTRPFVLAKTK